MDPFDYPLLGYQWNCEIYFDVVLPMGLKTAAMACQRSTSDVCYMLTQDGCYVVNYLDDFIGVASPDKALQDYEICGSLLRDLGLQESPSKACPPSTILTCLGVNTRDLTLSVTPARLQELENLLLQWSSRRSATKSELQSLIGKLSIEKISELQDRQPCHNLKKRQLGLIASGVNSTTKEIENEAQQARKRILDETRQHWISMGMIRQQYAHLLETVEGPYHPTIERSREGYFAKKKEQEQEMLEEKAAKYYESEWV